MRITIGSNLFLIQSYHSNTINVFVNVLPFVNERNFSLTQRALRNFENNLYGGKFALKGGKWEMLQKDELFKDLRCFITDASEICAFIQTTISQNISSIIPHLQESKDLQENSSQYELF